MNVEPLHLNFNVGHSMIRRMWLIVVLLLLALQPVLAQTVTTDKDDYQPGQYVLVTGTGWEPGETVLLDFHETPQVCATDGHERSTVAKEDGSIYYDQFLINDWHLGVSFELTATGQTSGSIAKAFFTDAPQLSSITPDKGPAIGGVEVTISGNGLFVNQWNLTIKFGELIAEEVANSRKTVNTGNNQVQSLKVVVPPQAVGDYFVKAIVTKTVGKMEILESNRMSFTYTKSKAILSLDDLIHTYDGTEKSAAVTTSPADLEGVSITYNGSTTAPINAGVYDVLVSLDNPNYEAESVAGKLIISKANHVIRWANPQHIVYGTALSANQLNASLEAGDGQLTYSPSAGTILGAGSHTLKVKAAETANYNAAEATVTLQVDKATPSLALTIGGPYTYDGTPKVAGVELKGVLESDNLGSATVTYSKEGAPVASPVAAGEYTVTASFSGNENYLSKQTIGTLTINPKQVTARISAQDKVYDGSEQAIASGYIAASDLVGSDQVDVTVQNAAFSDKNVGTAKTVSADVSITNSNYTLSNATASTTASITAKPIAGSFTAQNKVYDGTTTATVAESILLGTISGDDISLTGGAASFANKNAGTGKSVTLTGAALSGADKDNYTLTSVAQALADITRRPASVTPNAVSKVYGTLDPAFSGKLEGFVAADEIIVGFLRPLGEWVGKYDIVATLFPEEALRNYTITYNKGYLEITPAELVVMAHNASRTYGEDNPEFTGSVTGIVREGEIEISFTSVATPESAVGTYAITPELSGAALMNYNVTATNGILTIEKAALSLQVHDKTRKYGEANPTFDGTFTGLKNNDPITPTYSTDATATSNVGEYPISASLVDPKNKLGNYQVSISDGVLTILPASAEIQLSGLSKVYNGQAQGVEVATMPEGLAVNITYNSEAIAPTKAGSYAVVASLANSNYTAPDAMGTLVIAPKEVSASLSNPGKVYDGTTAAPGTTATLNGIVSGDEVTALVSEAAFSSPNAGERTVAATVSLQGADVANYELKQVTAATSTISKAPLTITAPSMSKFCGQDDPLTGYACTVTGAVNQEQIQTSYAIAGTDVLPASTDAKLANYEVTLVKGTLTINGLVLDASSASTPRSVNEEVSINISVKDGETAVAGVKVDLLLDGVLRATAISSANGTATFNLGKLTAKVYSVQAVAGGNGCAASQVVYLPIYDPDGGFVTGGGWINSPREALATDPEVTGKANFGFVAKYKKGKNEVDGNTEFQFQNGNINFKSSSHTAASLVISGAKATYKGKGFINGGGMEYDFMVVATDGDVNGGGGYDKFRIKIWSGGNVVYDNARGTAENAELGDDTRIGGGSIVIHENKSLNGGSSTKKLAAMVTPEQLSANFLNYPNPYTDKTTITFSVEKDEQFALEVYDVKGARVRKTEEGMAEAGKVYEFEFSANSLPEGVYFARLTMASGVKTIKMVLKK